MIEIFVVKLSLCYYEKLNISDFLQVFQDNLNVLDRRQE